ncbi:MAG: glucose 1-dehydrogenase [Candidatus Lokiarchaeota archaeon]|nr:glucose 1-dehydrogenase [Candidatus Lokiarchaeota archaeon]
MEGKRLKDKVCLVSGAGSGIGRGISERYASEGASLVICDVNSESVEKTRELILNKYPDTKVISSKTDISKKDQIKALVELTYDNFDYLNVLVNNAGIGGPEANLLKVKIKDFDHVMNINLRGTWMMCKYFGLKMKRQKQLEPLRGKIINISSAAGKEGHPLIGAYSITKFGVIGLTQSLAKDLAPRITVNAICPGMIKTNIYLKNEELMQVALDTYKFPLWMKRWGRPEDVANVAFFLASDDSNYMTGQAINITGGMMMH